MLQQLLLHRVEHCAVGNALNGLYRLTFNLSSQYKAGAHQSIIDENRAGAAITGVTANLGANEFELVPQHVGQNLPGSG
jgi:hypothetical protein